MNELTEFMFDNRKLRLVLAIACLAMGAAQAHAGDVSKGEKVFKKCMACHTVADKANKVGPYLAGLVNRPVASAEGYAYSDGMKEFAAKQPAWDEAVLDKYLENPKAMVPKTKMAFAGLKKADERADLIAYLLTKQ